MRDIEQIEKLVDEVRRRYLVKFCEFIEEQRRICEAGAAEVKFALTGETNAFGRMAVVDFVCNGEGVRAVNLEPEIALSFERFDGAIGNARLIMDGLRWDGVVILHDVRNVEGVISAWFKSWFDPDESVRFDKEGYLSQCIHVLYIEHGELLIDFGTASATAFWEILDCLVDAGATRIHITA